MAKACKAEHGSAPKAKPYQRALTVPVKPSKALDLGAPSSLGQSSRKGKKAWRKNIDISQEEVAMEQAREEERVTG